MEKVKCAPHIVDNVDDTGMSIVQNKHTTVIALQGKRQIAAVQSIERGALITLITCMNAACTFVPPLIIFPRKNMEVELKQGAPPGAIHACYPSGWVQQDIFTKWFSHFLQYVKPSKDDPDFLFQTDITHTLGI